MEQILDDGPMFGTSLHLLKKAETIPGLWKFGGIASSEAIDAEGDVILRKVLDVSYLAKRGYVNWDHSRAPADQLGFTTRAEIIEPNDVGRYEEILDVPLEKTVSVYVEGALYQSVKKAQEVYEILKSIPSGVEGALGLSVEGAMVRNEDKSIARAVVRGCAMTPVPAHPDTLCRLVKSLSLSLSNGVGQDQRTGVRKSTLTFNDAVVRMLEYHPTLGLARAKRLVKGIFEQLNKSGDDR